MKLVIALISIKMKKFYCVKPVAEKLESWNEEIERKY
jgi:hypothetical protein